MAKYGFLESQPTICPPPEAPYSASGTTAHSGSFATTAGDEKLARSLVHVLRVVFVIIPLSVLCLMTFLVTVILLGTGAGNNNSLILLTLTGSIFWTIAYLLLPLPERQTISMTTNSGVIPTEAPNTKWYNHRGRLLSYAAASGAISFSGLCAALILAQYGYLKQFVIGGPLLLLFPFSYAAYTSFQQKVRVERLRRDFALLGAPWDEDLAKLSLGFPNFALHIILAMLTTLLGLTVLFWPHPEGLSAGSTAYIADISIPISFDILQAMRYGFLGAYLVSAQLIYRRYTTYDLQPPVYFYGAINMLAGLGFNYVAFTFLTTMPVSEALQPAAKAIGPIIAFALGFFPPLALRILTRYAYGALNRRQRRSEILSLEWIDGLSELHEIRLRDHGIDNIQNLAAADIPFLLINTTFSVQQVIDWVDQALLYLYLHEVSQEMPPFADARVRTISDFRDVWKDKFEKRSSPDSSDKDIRTQAAALFKHSVSKKANGAKDKSAPGLGAPAQSTPFTPGELDLLYEATTNGPNTTYVEHYWWMTKKYRQNTYFIDTGKLRNPEYNQVVAAYYQAINTYPCDEKLLEVVQQQAKDLESKGSVVAYNSLAMAGEARLQWDSIQGKTPDRFKRLVKVANAYVAAIQHNYVLEDWINTDLKEIGCEIMNIARDYKMEAVKNSNQLQSDTALSLARSAVEISRWWDVRQNNAPELSYLAELIEFEADFDEWNAALSDLDDADDYVKKFRQLPPISETITEFAKTFANLRQRVAARIPAKEQPQNGKETEHTPVQDHPNSGQSG